MPDNFQKNNKSIKNRCDLYRVVFNQFIEMLENDINQLMYVENNVTKERQNFFRSFKKLDIYKYDSNIFTEIKSQIEEFKIELQLSALNAKIKSLDMKEFSNIISVIGLSLEEESIKVTSRFDELKKAFDSLVNVLHDIETDLMTLEKVKFVLSENFLELVNFMKKEVLAEVEDCFNGEQITLFNVFDKLISMIEGLLEQIYYIKNTRFSLNLRQFKHSLNVCLRKIRLLIKDYSNFVFKINYLTLITKIEVGKLKENEFIMVLMTLDNITEEAKKINIKINKISSYFFNIISTLEKIHSEYSFKLRNMIFREYFEIAFKIQDELEAMMKFLKNETANFLK